MDNLSNHSWPWCLCQVLMTQNRQHQCPLSRRFSNHGHTVQYMLRYPHIYCQQQIDQQRAYEVDHPAECHDFGDRGHLLSCDSIESVEHVETFAMVAGGQQWSLRPGHTAASCLSASVSKFSELGCDTYKSTSYSTISQLRWRSWLGHWSCGTDNRRSAPPSTKCCPSRAWPWTSSYDDLQRGVNRLEPPLPTPHR